MPASILCSVHDVSPETLPLIDRILARLERLGAPPTMLLVIPGGDWTDRDLARIRAWEAQGHALAAHGWIHRSGPPAGLYHRLHSLFFSRDAAEHLGRSRAALLELVRRSHAWFASRGLRPPDLYVPPAWASGALRPRDYRETPFRWVEFFDGIYDVTRGRLLRLPVTGFMADTRARKPVLKAWNGAQLLSGALLGRPVRVAIHPHDLECAMASDLEGIVSRARAALSYADASVLE